MVDKPNISPDFTIDDIHKIREYHYELTKDMSTQERIAFYTEGADKVQEEINKHRKEKELVTQ